MDNKTQQVQGLKELREQLQEALETANKLGATTKAQTLRRMIDVINFDLYKLGVTD